MTKPNDEMLRGWGEIAAYLKIGVRTAQRKARKHGLPVRRPSYAGPREPVFAIKSELDHWRFASGPRPRTAVPQVPLPGAAELALPALKHILSLGELTKLYRRDYFMRFDLRSSRGGIVADIHCRYELCNASDERQPFVQEVTVDDSDHGYVASMSFSAGERNLYTLKRPRIAERFSGWVAYRGPQQWIEPGVKRGTYLCRASWVIHRPANDIWYNHMLLPTVGLTIETHASAGFEISRSFSERGLIMKGTHVDISWRRRTSP